MLRFMTVGCKWGWAALLGCAAASAWGASPIAKGEFRFRLTADPTTLDWNLARTSYETYVIMNVMEGLVEEGPDLKARPALADQWEISNDGKTYTFHLRPGVKWSDGRPLKASDFVDSWIRLLDPKTHSSYASFLFDIENAEAFHQGKLKDRARVGVKASDDSNLVVKLRTTVPYFIHLPSFWVTFPIRADLIRKYGKSWATPGKLATLGPYQISEWKRGKEIRLTKNASYYGSAALPAQSVEQVRAVIEPDDAKARSLFASGATDVLLDATTEDLVKSKSQSAPVRVEQFPYLATYYLGFNVNSGPLKSPAIRKAIGIAVDRAGIPPLLQGGQQAAGGWVPPGIEGHDSALALSGTLYDARGSLTRAGYAEGGGFPKLSLWVEKFDGAGALAEFIAKSIRDKLGVEIESRVASSSAYQEAVNQGHADLFVGHWGADYPDAANFFDVFESGSGTNYTRWKNAEYDALLKTAAQTLDQSARMQAFASAEKILIEKETVILPLFYRRNTALVGNRVKDFSISPLNYLFLKRVTLK